MFQWDGNGENWHALYRIIHKIPSYQSHACDRNGNVGTVLEIWI